MDWEFLILLIGTQDTNDDEKPFNQPTNQPANRSTTDER